MTEREEGLSMECLILWVKILAFAVLAGVIVGLLVPIK
jgi:hypothetical protein